VDETTDVSRAVSAALHTPQLGGPTLSQGAQNSVLFPLSTPEKASIPKVKYETLEISEGRGPLTESAYALQLLWPLWKQGIYTLQLLLGPFESKVAYAVGPL